MKRGNNIYIFFIYFFFAIVFLACKKFVQIPDSKSQIPADAVFSDSTDATSAVLGIYVNIMKNSGFVFINGGVTAYTSLSSDELVSNNANNSNELQIYSNSISATTNSINQIIWNNAYVWIYQTNACIEGITLSDGLSSALKNQLIGEAKFMRALLYFNLVNLYGDVPLATTTNFQINGTLPRTSTVNVYNQIINDLTDAQKLLTTEYVSAGKVRPNRYAATALLARVYLYQRQWENAEATSSIVINSGEFRLVQDLNSVFLANSDEAILQLIPLSLGTETSEGHTFIPASNIVAPPYNISDYLLGAFEFGDQRRLSWLGKSTVVVGGVSKDFYYPFKYQHRQDGLSDPLDYYMILRLAEQYLIRAEARAQLNTNLTDAISDLNIIRNRAKLTSLSNTLSQSQILDAVTQERRIELFCEMGHRWFDLKRTDMVNIVMPDVTSFKGGNWNSNWQIYPVPLAQLQANPFLKQNNGY